MNSLQEKSIDWKTSALIVVDMQNDFVRKGAPWRFLLRWVLQLLKRR